MDIHKAAVERPQNYDDWFSREVDKGVAAADAGDFVEQDDVRRMIERRYPDGPPA